jgi:flavin-dependent dehydrogenase
VSEKEGVVAVLGGGPAGAATAVALRRRGIETLLVERNDYTGVRVGEHLAPSTMVKLDRLALREIVLGLSHRRCAGIRSAWGSDELAERDYLFNAYGEGLNLDRNAFDASLAGAAEQAGARVLRNTRCTRAERVEGGWALSLEGPAGRTTARARFAVDATGRAAFLGRSQGSRRVVHDRLIGITAFLDLEGRETDDQLLIEAAENGWWYSAALADGRLVVSFATDADLLSSSAQHASALWEAELHRSVHTAARVGRERPAGEVHVRAADSALLSPSAGDDWLAVGDAALGLDPLSSSGIAHGLDHAFEAAGAIEALFAGDRAAIARYATARRAELDEYLAMRSSYYGMEKRWPGSLFWRRRRRPPAERVPVTLDPAARVRLAIDAAGAARAAADLSPSLAIEALCDACPEPRAASEVLEAHRRAHPGAVSDRELIVALQALIERGVFTIVA